MKNKKTHSLVIKLVIISALLITALPIGVSAGSATLTADYATAKATLTCDFNWFSNDTAKATTKRTYLDLNSPTTYRVAVRLEEWETSKKCTRYNYKSGVKSVSLSADVKDVYQFASRHSIDNENNTKEFAYKSFIEAE